jgi:hypothetical protein
MPAPSVAQPTTEPLETIIARVKEDLAKRQGAPIEAIGTLSTAEATWRDTSMGCGKPAASYAKIDIEGYRIILAYRGQHFDYRVRQDGHFVLCTGALKERR